MTEREFRAELRRIQIGVPEAEARAIAQVLLNDVEGYFRAKEAHDHRQLAERAASEWATRPGQRPQAMPGLRSKLSRALARMLNRLV